VLAAVAGIAVLAAACGGSSPTTAGQTGHQRELAYAHCMRAHGVPGFPDLQGLQGSGTVSGAGQGGAGRNSSAVPAQGRPRDQEERYDPRDPVVQVEREALKLAVQRPALCGPSFDALGAGCFTAPVHAAVFELIAGCGGTSGGSGGREWAERLRAAAPDDRARGFVTQLAVEPLRAPRADGEPDARYADAVLARIEELAVSRQLAGIKSRLQRLSPVAEPTEYNRMFGDLVALEGRHRALMERAPDSM